MYKVNFTKEVVEIILDDLRSKITKREEWRLARAEEVEFTTMEVWRDMIQTLQNDPYSYLKYNDVFLAIELYMPFVLVYTVDGDNVLIISAMRRE